MQSKWNQSKALFEKVLGMSDLNKAFLSSLSWYDEAKVHDSVKARTRQYLNGYVASPEERANVEIFDYPNYTEQNTFNYGHPSWSKFNLTPWLTGGLVDKNLVMDMNHFPAAIIAGQFSGFNLNAGNVALSLPAYFEQEDMHAYDAFASRHPVIYGNIQAQTDDVNIRNRNIIGEYNYDTSERKAVRFDFIQKHNSRMLGTVYNSGMYDTDVTTAIELKNPIITSTAFIARRIWEPFELIIPTTLKPTKEDWKDKSNWQMVEGYENSNTYALMDKLSVASSTVDVNGVMCYPVTVPLMYRPPKNAFDIACRMMNNTFSSRVVSPMGWFDYLCNDKPFLYTFHVADIAYLMYVYKKRKDMAATNYVAAPEYQESVYLYNPVTTPTITGGIYALAAADEKALLKEIGQAIGISPLLLKVEYITPKGNIQAKVSYSDEKMAIGIPMFAGSINICFDGKATIPPINVGVQSLKDQPNPSNMTDEELKSWLKNNRP